VLKSGQAMGCRGCPCGHAMSPAHGMPRPLSPVFRSGYLTPEYPTPGTGDLGPDTRDLRPVATGTPVDPVGSPVSFPVPISAPVVLKIGNECQVFL